MNGPIWLAWIVVGIFAVISVVIFTGKAPFLIAGYNMESQEEKSKYNLKRLCKIIGGGLSVITVIIALIVYYEAKLPPAIAWISPWGILGTVVVMLILSNTICKK